MDEKPTQREIIISKLSEDGFVSRNWCLQSYISRLANYIFDLKQEGWQFTQDYYRTQWGKDYRYYVVSMPSKYHNNEQLKLF